MTTTEKKCSYGYKAVVVKDYYRKLVWQEYNKKTKTYEPRERIPTEPTVKAGKEIFFSSKSDLKAASPGGEGLRVALDWDGGCIVPPEYLKLYKVDYETVITKTVTETAL